jgi:hypothetical protein
MKKLSTLIVLLSALGLTAAAQAEVSVNVSVPIAPFAVFVPCANGGAGEIVDFTGDLHILVTFTVNGNRISGVTRFQPQGVSGIGSVTGEQYRATGGTQEQIQGSLVNGQFSDTFLNNFRIIGVKTGNNFLVHETAHLTFRADGIVTAFIDNLGVDCK